VIRTFRTLANPADAADLHRRLTRLRPDSPRQWGRMTAHQMVCHLRDAFLMGTDRKPVSEATGPLSWKIVKWGALYAPLRWPPGIPTRPEIDQTIGGTRPADFESDVAELAALLREAASTPEFFESRRHPIFGPLSNAEWLRWGYLHVDHHLRQFAL
jgi:hypothetical protein